MKSLPMIEVRGVIIAGRAIELATRGQINIAPATATIAGTSAFSTGGHKQISFSGATPTRPEKRTR